MTARRGTPAYAAWKLKRDARFTFTAQPQLQMTPQSLRADAERYRQAASALLRVADMLEGKMEAL